MEAYSNRFVSDMDSLGVLEEEDEGFQFDQEKSDDSDEEKYPGDREDELTAFNELPDHTFSSVEAYFREVGQVPLLRRTQECDLARRIEEGEKRVKALLLQSPVGLDWLTRVVSQMKMNEIRSKISWKCPPIPLAE